MLVGISVIDFLIIFIKKLKLDKIYPLLVQINIPELLNVQNELYNPSERHVSIFIFL